METEKVKKMEIEKNKKNRMSFKNVSKKKVIIGVLLIIGIVIVVVKSMSGEKASGEAMVTTAPISIQDIEETLTLKAPLEGAESVEILSNMHSEILSINVKEGDKVTKDQLLAVIDAESIEDQIAILQDNLELLKIKKNSTASSDAVTIEKATEVLEKTLKDDQVAYTIAITTLATEQKAFEDAEILFKEGYISQKELDDKQNTYNEATYAVEKFNVVDGQVVATPAQLLEIENLKTNTSSAIEAKSIEIATKEVQRKRKELEDCNLKSSINGTVTRVNTRVGRFANEAEDSKPLFVIENLDVLKMKGEISEYDIMKIKEGQEVRIDSDILGDKEATGMVSRISPTGEVKNGTNERFIPIQIDVKEGAEHLIAGVNVDAEILLQKAEGAMVIPIECLKDNNDGTFGVYVVICFRGRLVLHHQAAELHSCGEG